MGHTNERNGRVSGRKVPSPHHPRFVDDVLRPLAERRAAGEPERRLVEELYETAVHPWAMTQARMQTAGLPAHADASEVVSQVLRLAWEACLKIDWTRLESWPWLLDRKVAHARIEAARVDDWLSRRERVYRRRYQRAVAEVEQLKGRALTDAERADVAATVAPASNRVDWAKELLSAKHPSSVADVPDLPTGSDVEDVVEDRLMSSERARRLQEWLDVVAAQDPRLVEDLYEWRNGSTDNNRALPSRLARRIRNFAPLLVGLVAEDV